MFYAMHAQQHRVHAAARRSAEASCCTRAASAGSANGMMIVLDAAFVASIFVACLLGRITLFALLALVVLVRLPLRSLTALPLQSPLS